MHCAVMDKEHEDKQENGVDCLLTSIANKA